MMRIAGGEKSVALSLSMCLVQATVFGAESALAAPQTAQKTSTFLNSMGTIVHTTLVNLPHTLIRR